MIHESKGHGKPPAEVEGRPTLDKSLMKSLSFRTGDKISRKLHHRLRPLESVFERPRLNGIHGANTLGKRGQGRGEGQHGRRTHRKEPFVDPSNVAVVDGVQNLSREDVPYYLFFLYRVDIRMLCMIRCTEPTLAKVKSIWRRATERRHVSAKLLCGGDDMSVCGRFVIVERDVDNAFQTLLVLHSFTDHVASALEPSLNRYR